MKNLIMCSGGSALEVWKAPIARFSNDQPESALIYSGDGYYMPIGCRIVVELLAE